MSTYSPSLRIQLIPTGDQAGTWGNTTNTNLGTLIESAIAGYISVSVISANQALTALDGAADQSRNMSIALTTTTGANFAVYAPPAEKTYVIYNASAYTATLYNSTVLGNTTAAGAGTAIPSGKTMTVWSDGTNFKFQNTHMVGSLDGNATGIAGVLPVANGGTSLSTPGTAGNILTSTGTDFQSGGGAATTPGVITFSATAMAVNCLLSNVFATTFTANVTVAPTLTNPINGQTINWFITQDATGGRTMTWPSSFKWSGGSSFAGILSTSANSVDLLVITYRSTTGFWYASLAKAFS